MKKLTTYLPDVIALFGALIFLDSLRYKFTNHPNTQTIFGILNDWVLNLGLPALFAPSGIFSQYVIGGVELIAAVLLLVGILPRFKFVQAYGAVLAALVMTGAVSFHLFTPLGIDPNNDGGGLFVAAVLLLLGSYYLLYTKRTQLLSLLKK